MPGTPRYRLDARRLTQEVDMNPVKVRNTVIGEGMPKICVPIVATDKEGILRENLSLKSRRSIRKLLWK